MFDYFQGGMTLHLLKDEGNLVAFQRNLGCCWDYFFHIKDINVEVKFTAILLVPTKQQ